MAAGIIPSGAALRLLLLPAIIGTVAGVGLTLIVKANLIQPPQPQTAKQAAVTAQRAQTEQRARDDRPTEFMNYLRRLSADDLHAWADSDRPKFVMMLPQARYAFNLGARVIDPGVLPYLQQNHIMADDATRLRQCAIVTFNHEGVGSSLMVCKEGAATLAWAYDRRTDTVKQPLTTDAAFAAYINAMLPPKEG